MMYFIDNASRTAHQENEQLIYPHDQTFTNMNNMNPSLPLPPGHVHVMNMNMLPQLPGVSDQFSLTDLDNIPAQLLYEWSKLK